MSDTNPALPVALLNRIAAAEGLEAIQIDSPLTFAEAEDRAALAAELGGARAPADVADATARLALTTATVRNGACVREIGRSEITKLTCLGSTYAAAVAEVTNVLCVADVADSLHETAFYIYRQSDNLLVLFWFNTGGGTAPDYGGEGVDVHYIEVPIATGAANTVVAEALKVAADADAAFTATRSSATVSITCATAGAVDDGFDVSSGFTITPLTQGAGATHTLQGTTLTLYGGALGTGAARAVGFSLAGNVGDIAVTLPTSTRTSAQIAALAQTAIEAHADFTATVSTNEVTVTNVAKRAVTNASAGSTGFTVAVLTQGITPTGLTYLLTDEAAIASEDGWSPLARNPDRRNRMLVDMFATPGTAIAQNTFTDVTWTPGVTITGTEINVGTCLDKATGIFTAAEDMTIAINTCVRIHNAAVPFRAIVAILLADVTGAFTYKKPSYAESFQRIGDTAGKGVNGTYVISLLAGQRFKLQVYHNVSGGDFLGDGQTDCYLQIMQLR